ncbi:MAG TPA: pentapeptide repeat-containing protein, partial [Anaerolineae bacterium]|nr:pentapeptide repeat-containing protein [Anaerolineae bacterium]
MTPETVTTQPTYGIPSRGEGSRMMEAKDLVRRYSAGERDFAGANLSGAMLGSADLRKAWLSDVNLERVDLSG